jgi:aspartate aminotransferase
VSEALKVSAKVHQLSETGTVAISARAAALAATGRDLVNLSVGAPDFDTPEHAARAAIEAIERGETRYTSMLGSPELREAIRLKFHRDNGLDYQPGEITIGAGGKQVLLNVLLASIDPGDEVIVPAPYYSSYPDIVRLAGGTPVIVTCPGSDGFKLRPETLIQAITSRTRWLLLNSPSNPTGAVATRSELEAIAEVLREHPRVAVLADEIYDHCLFTGEPYASFAALDEEMFARTVTVNGVSKTYAMTGWRIGFAGGPAELVGAATKVQGQSTTCPSSVSQVAAAAALAGPQDLVRERREILRQRRDLAMAYLSQVPGLRCPRPDGALYLYLSCEGLIGRERRDGGLLTNDMDVAQFFLDAASVATVPGIAFGGSPYLRVTFSLSPDKLERAARQMTEAVQDGLAPL